MKILAIGKNYLAHIKELKGSPSSNPVIFIKSENTLNDNSGIFYYTKFLKDIHYEIELVLKLGKRAKNIPPENALDFIDAIGVGLDFTQRTLQMDLKKKGLPWELAKSFDSACYIGKMLPLQDFLPLENLYFSLVKNGRCVQQGHTENMIFSIPQLLAYATGYITLEKGDYVFTGTPQGVGPIAVGDVLQGYLLEQQMFHLNIKADE